MTERDAQKPTPEQADETPGASDAEETANDETATPSLSDQAMAKQVEAMESGEENVV